MRVNREHVPRHAIAAWSEPADAEAHHVPAYALAMVDARAGCVAHLGPAEHWFKCFGEIERDLARGGATVLPTAGLA